MKIIKTFPVRFFLVLILLIALVSLSIGTLVGAQTPTPTTAPSASAAASPSPSASPTQQVVFGQVMSLATDKTSFVVQNEDLKSVTVNVGTTTRYFIVTIAVADISGLLGGMGDMMGMGDMSDDDNVPGMSNMPGMSNA
jgi:Na+-transporting methylmalonyl-CoA/oxaloacetate decarboxylase gamma subunit